MIVTFFVQPVEIKESYVTMLVIGTYKRKKRNLWCAVNWKLRY